MSFIGKFFSKHKMSIGIGIIGAIVVSIASRLFDYEKDDHDGEEVDTTADVIESGDETVETLESSGEGVADEAQA